MIVNQQSFASNGDRTVTTNGQAARGGLVALVVLFVTLGLSDWGRAVAAGSSALAIYIFIDGCWAYRKTWWLWTIFMAVVAAHVGLVCLVSWPDWGKGNLPLLPVGWVKGSDYSG